MIKRSSAPPAPTELLSSRVAPHSLETERAILGALLVDGTLATGALQPGHFFLEKHRMLFKLIRDMGADGAAAVDLVTVTELLKVFGKLEDIGGRAGLAQLVDEAGMAATLPSYVNIVLDHAARREAIKHGAAVMRAAYEPTADLAQLRALGESIASACTAERDGFEPIVTRAADTCMVRWPNAETVLIVQALHENSDGLRAEVTVERRGRVLVPVTSINLLSTRGRAEIVSRMKKGSTMPWEEMLESAVQLVIEALREATPAVAIVGPIPHDEPDLIPGVAPLHQPTLFFGDGDVGKSLVLKLLALGITSGRSCCGLRSTVTGPVVYCDFESDLAPVQSAILRLEQGTGLSSNGGIFYKSYDHRPLWDVIRDLHREVARVGAVAVLIDTLGAASGAEPESPGAAIQAMNCLRSLAGVTKLISAHVSKQQADQRGPVRPFGSVYVRNLARSCWEVTGSADGAVRAVTLFQRKANDSELGKPITFRFTFDGRRGPISVDTGRLTDSDAQMSKATTRQRVEAVLAAGKPLSIEEIAEAVGEKGNTVYKTLARMAKDGAAVKLSGSDNVLRWGLKTTRTI